MDKTTEQVDAEEMEWRVFLTEKPPGTSARVDRALYLKDVQRYPVVKLSECPLYCEICKDTCSCVGQNRTSGKIFGGITKADNTQHSASQITGSSFPFDVVIQYSCERCGWVAKSYSLRFFNIASSVDILEFVEVKKIAEWPLFLPRTPSKVMNLIGPDRQLFLKGRRAESEGLGIGAFTYYRRIIEGQKNRLLDEIIKVAKHLNASEDTIRQLEAAKKEIQFSKAVDSVKEGIPKALYIKGHNPFTLLHSALSEGLHDATDEACLVAANDIRLILVEFAERLTEAMKEQKDLDNALTRLLNRKK